MNWTEFASQYNIENLITELTESCLEEFFKDNPNSKIVAFGADCNVTYGDVFISILTEDGIADVPEEWKENWEWIAEWDFWDFNEGFENYASYNAIKEKLDELLYDLDTESFEKLQNNFMDTVCEVLIGIKAKYKNLDHAQLIIRNHGDLTKESQERINNAAFRCYK